MRVKLRYLFWVFLAFFLAVGWVNHKNSYKSRFAVWDKSQYIVRAVHRQVASELEKGTSLNELEKLFAGQLPPNHPLARSFAGHFLVDYWYEPIRFVKLNQDDDDVEKRFGIYSTGADRASASDGNDLDDINSWAKNSTQHYQDKDRMSNMIEGLIYAPYFLVALIGLDWLVSSGILRRQRATTRNAIDDAESAAID